MSIDKKIKYEEVPQLVKKTKGKKRKGYRGLGGYGGGPGGGAAAGGGLGEGPASDGGSGGGGDRDDRREQRSVATTQGISPTTQSALGVDRSAVGQFSTYGRNVMNQNLDSLRPTLGFTDAAKVNLLSPKSIGTGLLSLATGLPFGLMNFFSNLSTRPSTNLTEDDIIGGGGGGGNNRGIMNVLPPIQTIQPVQGQPEITKPLVDPNRQAYYDQLYQQLIQGGINPTSAANIAQYRTNINFV